jgi:hypothetical protein
MCDETTPENAPVHFSQNAMPVGRCNAYDTSLDSCTGGGNAFGDFEWENGKCNAGNVVGVYVTCAGSPPSSPRLVFFNLSSFPLSLSSFCVCLSLLFLFSLYSFSSIISFSPAYFCVW